MEHWTVAFDRIIGRLVSPEKDVIDVEAIDVAMQEELFAYDLEKALAEKEYKEYR
jgi:hypothetical protein